MYTSLVNASDSWQLFNHQGILYYRYIASSEPISGIENHVAAIGKSGNLHLLLTMQEEYPIYTYWNDNQWKSQKLPLKGHILGFSLDSQEQPHILIKQENKLEIQHIFLINSDWQKQNLPLNPSQSPILFKPLPQGKLLIISYSDTESPDVLITIYSSTEGWMNPVKIPIEYSVLKIFAYWYLNYIYFLLWTNVGNTKRIQLIIVDYEKMSQNSFYLGETNELPDTKPVLLGEKENCLFIWTNSNNLSFCLSQDNNKTWLTKQNTYMFYPAQIKTIKAPLGPSTTQVAFTKVSGLELTWPLIVDLKPILALCKATLSE
ncbi:MAG: hypothetical protein PWP31_1185 [Clostridia bacterium]|nr:hypothetical protein [Clostridia bacterium]